MPIHDLYWLHCTVQSNQIIKHHLDYVTLTGINLWHLVLCIANIMVVLRIVDVYRQITYQNGLEGHLSTSCWDILT